MRTILVAALLTACAPAAMPPAQNSGSRGPRVDDHIQAARDHEQRAAELARWPERRSDITSYDDPATGLWYRAFDTAKEEQRLAMAHRSAAAELQAEYNEACGERPLAEVSISPITRYGIGATQTATGVVIFLGVEAGTRQELMAALRCHRAWMMIDHGGMADCPLDLAGIELEAYGDATGVSLEITSPDPRVVTELQRRTARELESRKSVH
jgi:hypothetical protein